MGWSHKRVFSPVRSLGCKVLFVLTGRKRDLQITKLRQEVTGLKDGRIRTFSVPLVRWDATFC